MVYNVLLQTNENQMSVYLKIVLFSNVTSILYTCIVLHTSTDILINGLEGQRLIQYYLCLG